MQNLINNLERSLRADFGVALQTIALEIRCFLSLMLDETLNSFQQSISKSNRRVHLQLQNNEFRVSYQRTEKHLSLQLAYKSQGEIQELNEQYVDLLLSRVSQECRTPLTTFLEKVSDTYQVVIQANLLAGNGDSKTTLPWIERVTQDITTMILELSRSLEKYSPNKNLFSQTKRFRIIGSKYGGLSAQKTNNTKG